MAKKNRIKSSEVLSTDSKTKNKKEVVKENYRSSVKDSQQDDDGKTYNVSIETKEKSKKKSKPNKKPKKKSKFKEVTKIRDEDGKLLVKEVYKTTSRNGKTKINRDKLKFTKNFRSS